MKKFIFLMLSSLIILTSCKGDSLEKERDITEESLSVITGEYELDAKLVIPSGGVNKCLVILGGSGNTVMDGPFSLYEKMSNSIAKDGIAVLRYNKRSAQYDPNTLPKDFDIYDEYVEDLSSAVNLLKSTSKVNCEKIYVAGHSLGGYAIPLINSEVLSVDGFILLSASARPIEDLIEEQIEYLINFDGTVTEEEKSIQDYYDSEIDVIRNLDDYPDDKVVLGSYLPYWKTLKTYDPIEIAGEIDVPVLVIQGGKDYQVTNDDFELWKTFESYDLWTYKYYDNLSHIYDEVEGEPNPDLYVTFDKPNEEVIKDITKWILDN